MKATTMIGPLLQGFFVEHLLAHKHVSPRTVASYRDTFRLFLQFVWDKTHIEPSSLRLDSLDAPVILSFLDYLEVERRNSVRSRNARLAAIHSFFRWVALCDPESVGLATRVLAIPLKRTDRLLVQALTRAEIDALLAAPDRSLWRGRRDYALLLTMYNTGARVSEIIALRQEQVQFGGSALINLMGKGRKERSIPLWSNTAQVLKTWFHELESTRTPSAFPSHRGRQLSRNGVDYILQQAVNQAGLKCPSLIGKRISPHVVRHTTAMHLLQSGVDISLIALWLGHESIETTHVYIDADLATKQRALEKLAPAEAASFRFKPSDSVLAFLQQL
ncbi:tyrosine-type recombinase/integrase [Burkholderia multivorans]|uniref:tyrosine-type recombinase/integrase n=1 Tax=Burkholderia multivorans TaxID=87883 RepID=UPI00158CB7F1|nr:site-specific integrase [Burkholderia multivorans]MDR8877621.1 Tyrosine recombinase XerD [Burkholderia multivorans]MDR8883510.1 Tyrosine recombinase XerD [Burkholderia multivorans]MDR8889926.1 Tyrosine recombinase XerD [Burkholderia multivorans]MDR8896261.1 Tyrosine recombinase XerD [Burkholderia multivorans]MDR8902034.1 Tyrosine recombinase XerD [Burkholderia multivorans]